MIEIGPANVLAAMAQRTLSSKYEEYDAVHSIQRQILTWSKDAKEICYDIEKAEKPLSKDIKEEAKLVSHVEQNQTNITPQLVGYRDKKAASSIPDSPLSSIDILRVIIAQKLKKPIKDISPQTSIKDLAGGKFRYRRANFAVNKLGNRCFREIYASERASRRYW